MIDLVIITDKEIMMIDIATKEIVIDKEKEIGKGKGRDNGKDPIEKKEKDVNTNTEDQQEDPLPHALDQDLIANNTAIDVNIVLIHVLTAMSATDMDIAIAIGVIMKEDLKNGIDTEMIIVTEDEIALTPGRTLILVHALLVDDLDTKKLNY